ncbi:MAG TPA: tryptophan 7-halogenase [Marinagarivorans sp.]
MPDLKSHYTVVIIGGGPAGCATAIALQQLGIKDVLVAEASDYTQPRIGESIPPDTRGLFSRLGLWQAFECENHEASMGSYSSWGSDRLGFNDFLFNPRGHGWHLDRLRFDQFMARETRLRGIDVVTEQAFKKIHYTLPVDRHGPQHHALAPLKLTFANGQQLTTQFVVDATGRAAKVARRLGATRKVDDSLVCIAAYFEHAKNTNAPATQVPKRMTLLEAVEDGWWYTARLPNNLTIAAIASEQHIIQQKNLSQNTAWHHALKNTQHVFDALGQPAMPTSLKTWVAPSVLLNPPAGSCWLAVGDAASAYDPISSQGIYKALKNALDAAPAIKDWLQGSSQGLLDYRRSVGEQFIHYLEQRAYFYDLEQRWPNAPFWRGRQLNAHGMAVA